MTVYIGTSGYQYKHWRGVFYPKPARGLDELAFYAERFASVELNGTFYKLPDADVFADWKSRVPEDFTFVVKASRFLTHIKRLRDPEEPVQRLMSRAERLGGKLGPVLLQLPPQLHLDAGRLRATLAAFPRGQRVAVELRHDSWFTSEIRSLLEEFNAPLCLADRGAEIISPEWRTADWGYIRFHSGSGRPPSCYTRKTLADRARMIERLFGSADVYAYFNNDGFGCAIRDASLFAKELVKFGLNPTRVPKPLVLKKP
jgi:uncharacterized protein YecE (DUF72 family)